MPASQLPAFGDIRAQGAPPDRRTLGLGFRGHQLLSDSCTLRLAFWVLGVQGSGFRGLGVQVVPARPRALGLGFQGLRGEGNYPARARWLVCESTHAEQLGSLGDSAVMVRRLGSRDRSCGRTAVPRVRVLGKSAVVGLPYLGLGFSGHQLQSDFRTLVLGLRGHQLRPDCRTLGLGSLGHELRARLVV
eukprot:1195376-Prorocentrum_minimum.AAC.6